MPRISMLVSGLLLLAVSGVLAIGEPGPDAPASTVPAGHPQIPLPQVAQEWPKPKQADVATIDAILKAFYEAPAGAPGQARDWDRYRSLFVPSARLIPARTGAAGAAGAYFLPVSEYIEANKTYFEKGGFSDREVARRTETFGNIVHVWSTYESRRKSEDAVPYSRGINSIQLLKDGDRYWIIGVFWDHEREDNPIPEKYLTSPTP